MTPENGHSSQLFPTPIPSLSQHWSPSLPGREAWPQDCVPASDPRCRDVCRCCVLAPEPPLGVPWALSLLGLTQRIPAPLGWSQQSREMEETWEINFHCV